MSETPPPDEIPFSAPGFGAPDPPVSSRDFAVLPQPAEPPSRIREQRRVNANPFEQVGPQGPLDPFGNPYGYQVTATYASWGIRFLSHLIDTLIVSVPITLLTGRNGTGVYWSTAVGGSGNTLRMALIAIASVANLGVLQGTTGQSLGKRIFSIKVVDQSTGMPIGIKRAVLRWIVSVAGNYIPMFVTLRAVRSIWLLWLIDYLFPLWDPRKQTLHDKAVKSVVIRS
jgi:uncharacterized RDD family membrane protein YckC